MTQQGLSIESVATSQGFTIKLTGDLYASTVPKLAETINSTNEKQVSRIVLDLRELNHIDSRGIGALVGWHRHFSNEGIEFEITNVPDSILRPLRICHLDSVLDIGPDAALTEDKLRLQREALWKFHDFAQQILAGLDEGLIAVNLDHEIVYLNPGAEAILDCVEESLIGKPLLESIHFLNLTKQEFLQCLASEETDRASGSRRHHREVEIRKSGGEIAWIRFILTPIFRNGIKQGTILNLVDISDEVLARRAGMRHLSRLESLRKVAETSRTGLDIEHTIESLLDTVREIFDCDRVWLLHPCDPDAATWAVQIESTTPSYPGAHSLASDIPMSDDVKEEILKCLGEEGPVVYDTEHPFPRGADWQQTFKIRAQMAIVIHPRLGKPWLFGLHHCSSDRIWTHSEKSLFQEISSRISDSLENLVLYRDRKAKEDSLESMVGLTSEIPSEAFFRNMIRYVCERLNVPHGFIGLLEDDNRISTLANWREGKDAANFSYNLEGTPCETVIGNQFQKYSEGLWEKFPNDTNLRTMGIKCYMGVPLKDSQGMPLGLIVVLDRSEGEQPLDARAILEVMADRVSSAIERSRSEEALERSETEIRAILSALPDPMIRINDGGDVLEVHLPSIDYFTDNLFSNECENLRKREAIWGNLLSYVEDSLRSQEIRTLEFGVAASNRVREYEARISPCSNDRAIVLFRDISERKNSETVSAMGHSILELISTGANLSQILDCLVQEAEVAVPGMWGSILLLDSETHRLTHASAPSLPEDYVNAVDGIEIGPNVGSCGTAAYRREPVFVSDIEKDPLWENFKELALEHGLKACWSVPIISSDHEVLGTFALYYRLPGTPDSFQIELIHQFGHLAALAIEKIRSAEEKARLEEQFRQTQKLESLGILAGGIAHDFNNLLVGILGNAGFALSDLESDHPVRECIQQIELSAQRASDLTRQLLAYSGRGKFLVGTVNPKTIVEEMSHLLKISIDPNAEMILDFDPQTPSVEADATQLRQVIMNLIINASDALEGKPGKIYVRTGETELRKSDLVGMIPSDQPMRGRYCFLEIKDTGCGMDSKTVSKIFDPFFTTKFTGRGLGLAAVLGIVRSHRGGLRVKSKPGKGTQFMLYFPSIEVIPHEDTSKPLDEIDKKWEGTGTILVVDDEESVRTLAERVLRREGFEVATADNGITAVEMVKASPQKFDLVLLDLTMPRLDGKQTFDKLISVQPNLKVVLTSGYNEEETTERFGGDKVAGFIQKPYRSNELGDYIRMILSQFKSRD